MKTHMCTHVEVARHTMFRQACDAVKHSLDAMCETSEEAMQHVVDKVFARLERDYLTVLVGKEAGAQGGLPCAERTLREELRDRLAEADAWFAELFPQEDCTDEPAAAVGEGAYVSEESMARSEEGAVGQEHENANYIAMDDIFSQQLERTQDSPVVKPKATWM